MTVLYIQEENNSNQGIHERVVQWNRLFFQSGLSKECQCLLSEINFANTEFIRFIEVLLGYIAKANFDPKSFTVLGAKIFSHHLESFHTSLWDMIPPTTNTGRLRLIDAYLQQELGLQPSQRLNFLEIGCGYPPVTFLETADKFPGWHCTAIDPNFPELILYDEQGNAACFDVKQQLSYIQYNLQDNAIQPTKQSIAADKRRFMRTLHALSPVDKARLIEQRQLILKPIDAYATDDRVLLATGLQDYHPGKRFDVIRCINVFLYYPNEVINHYLEKINELLVEGGYFIYGNVVETGGAVKFTVYRKEHQVLKKYYFCFDLLKFTQREFNGWWSYYPGHEDTLLLAELVRLISEETNLFTAINRRVDDFCQSKGYAYRDKDGFLHEKMPLMIIPEYEELNRNIFDSFSKDIIAVLSKQGYTIRTSKLGLLSLDFTAP